MAQAICVAGTPIERLDSVGFYVVAPNREYREQARRALNLEGFVQPNSSREAVNHRIEQYAVSNHASISAPATGRIIKAWLRGDDREVVTLIDDAFELVQARKERF
ncbi:MAG: hypothetical protein AAF585_08730 [Verrucomicrobiota bacterium]